MRGSRVRWFVCVGSLAASSLPGACTRAPKQGQGADRGSEVQGVPDWARLVDPAHLAKSLTARGGAKVQAQTLLHVAPQEVEAKGSALRGAQTVTTDTQLQLDGRGQYQLQEQNDQDGGRVVVYTGDQIAVQLRYGKLIKRTARAPEPQQVLQQALGGPAAFWAVFGRAAHMEPGPAGPAGAQTVKVSLSGQGKPPPSSSTPVDETAATISAWRQTAVPTELTGHIQFLPAQDQKSAVLVGFDVSGRFTARTAKGVVHGHMKVALTAQELGNIAPPQMPEDAEDLRNGQRTILEERALLEGLTGVKGSPRTQ